MITIARHRPAVHVGGTVTCVLLTLLSAPMAWSAPPLVPLPAPEYSFDLLSPTVEDGVVAARDVLEVGEVAPFVLIPGEFLGLFSPLDDLNALSGPNSTADATATFLLLFSVDRETVGLVPPDPEAFARDVPFNPQDQAWRGHAAGDQYLSLGLYTREIRRAFAAPSLDNSVLCRNHYNEGGTDFTARPFTSARDIVTLRVPQDNVNATGRLPRSADGTGVQHVYFSATGSSPSLPLLSFPLPPSGANIFYNPDPLAMYETMPFAAFLDLGLQQADDIDALVVFDLDEDGQFTPGDAVIFSLTPDSPTLDWFDDWGPGARIFVAHYGWPLMLLATPENLGLGAPSDNVNALEFAFCEDYLVCAELHGIRSLRGDLNCDDLVNAFDIDPFVLALTDPEVYAEVYPACDYRLADCNRDGLVNAFDIDPFVVILTGGG
jgi:hypothetical protein